MSETHQKHNKSKTILTKEVSKKQENIKIKEKNKNNTEEQKDKAKQNTTATTTTTTTEEVTSANNANVPDGGWGWMVAFGCFIITLTLPMVGPCFGILFSRYLLELGTSSTKTAWIFNFQLFLWNMMGMATKSLTQEFGWRKVAMIGSLVHCIGIILSALSPSANFLFFSFAILTGTGGGVATCICFVITSFYFRRHRGKANAIMMSGVCLGQLIGPQIVQYLQETYAFLGATLITGAIMMNSILGAALFHPVEWHMKKADKPKLESINEIDSEVPLLLQKKTERGNIRSFSLDFVNSDHEWADIVKASKQRRLLATRHLSMTSHMSIASSFAASTMDITGFGSGYIEVEGENNFTKNETKTEAKSMLKIIARILSTIISDLKIWRSPRAAIIALGATFGLNGLINFVMMVPFVMQVNGHSLESSAWCISISALFNLLARLSVSTMSDWPKFNVKICYVSGFIVLFITQLVFPFLNNLHWMLATMAIWGTGFGMNMGLYNLMMIEVMGLENLPTVFGTCCFTVGIGFIVLGPIIGIIRDTTQSYFISMWVTSGMLGLSIILWCFLPAAQVYDAKRTKNIETNKTP